MTYRQLWQQLSPAYGEREAQALVRTVLDEVYGMTLTDIVSGKVTQLSSEQQAILSKIMARIASGEPVQYVLGRAWFSGREFGVEPGVLIPRPETEMLCHIIADEMNALQPSDPLKILDIGTGSGCIAITLALDIKPSAVTACDISADALSIARENAHKLGANVDFRQADALNAPDDQQLWDVIVSNPPYICEKEKADMEPNVLDHEPEGALFVPDDDPALFYRAIASYASHALKHGARLFFECNPIYIDMMKMMLAGRGFSSITATADQFGRQRFISATKL